MKNSHVDRFEMLKYYGFRCSYFILPFMQHPVEPVRVFGGATLSISEVKVMEVTEDYLGLDESVRKCQNREPFENCTTRQYLDSVKSLCNCVPFALRYFSSSVKVLQL